MENSVNNQNSFLDHLIDSIIILDEEGRIKEINQSTLNLLGYRNKEDLPGKPMSSVSKNFSLKEIKDKIPLPDYEMVYLSSQKQEILVSVNITTRQKNIIFIARDIRKTKNLIEELTQSKRELEKSYTQLQESKDELIRSEKLAFTGRIAANNAHEIRNPLANVSMAVEQLKKAPRRPQYIETVLRNTKRINYLITELLNCARPPKLNIRPYNIHRVLEDVLESLKTKIVSQKVTVAKGVRAKLSRIKMDKEQMHRAFLNLATNAIEAMPNGGRLDYLTETNENFLVVKIRDTGKGIPEENIIRIFDPFFSSKPGGVGLGLTICYGVIVSHGGTIEVKSRLRKGTTFTISLPFERKNEGQIKFG
ncbi:MAG: ATP-binding protein [Planctomycetota bacterium]